MGFFKWLYPGLRIKRWVILCSFGMLMCSMGFVMTIIESQRASGSLMVTAGIFMVIVSIRKIVKSVTTVLIPSREGDLLNMMYSRGVLNNGPRIVAVGGGEPHRFEAWSRRGALARDARGQHRRADDGRGGEVAFSGPSGRSTSGRGAQSRDLDARI